MKFSIHRNTIDTHKSSSGKAIYFNTSYAGFNTGRSVVWFPISQLKFHKDENECGWSTLEIPDWLLKSKGFLGYADSLNVGFEELEVQ